MGAAANGRIRCSARSGPGIPTGKRRLQGDDHLNALISATHLAIDLRELGEVRAARDLDQDALVRYRRVLGEDHPETLRSANDLAADLHAVGEVRAARDLNQDTLARSRRVLGEDHRDTLRTAQVRAVSLIVLDPPVTERLDAQRGARCTSAPAVASTSTAQYQPYVASTTTRGCFPPGPAPTARGPGVLDPDGLQLPPVLGHPHQHATPPVQVHPADLPAVICFRLVGLPCLVETDASQLPASARSGGPLLHRITFR